MPLSRGERLFPPFTPDPCPAYLEGNDSMRKEDSQAAASGRAEAVGPPAAAGGLDLSLGHLGTSQVKRRWNALCGACSWSMLDADYQAAADQAGSLADPACPRCGKRAWDFHLED